MFFLLLFGTDFTSFFEFGGSHFLFFAADFSIMSVFPFLRRFPARNGGMNFHLGLCTKALMMVRCWKNPDICSFFDGVMAGSGVDISVVTVDSG